MKTKCKYIPLFSGYYPAIVTVEPCKNQRNQKWTLKDKSIVNIENPNRCLDVHKFNRTNVLTGTHIVEYKCKRGVNQIWDIKNWKSDSSPSDLRYMLLYVYLFISLFCQKSFT